MLLHISCLIFAMSVICLGYPRLSRPKLHGTAIPPQDLDPANNATKRKILLAHNFFRSRVDPPASDMLEMTWHAGAAEDAQRWAESCQLLLHDNITGRWTEDFGSCGQNIFVANVQVPWFFATKVWFLEKFNFTYGEDLNDPDVVGHYTQNKNIHSGIQQWDEDVTTMYYLSQSLLILPRADIVTETLAIRGYTTRQLYFKAIRTYKGSSSNV